MDNMQLTESLLSTKEVDNIKVYLRVRPLNTKEKQDGSKNLLHSTENTVYLTKNKDEKKNFTYDHVFDQEQNQEQIFKEIGGQLVEQFLEGYNCTVFAYGQTGAGKTFTMLGDHQNEQNRGLKPRSLEYLFYLLKERENSENLIKITYVEIYNERIIDLLSDKESSLNLREDIEKGVFIENVKEVVVKTYADVQRVVEEGLKRRHVSFTSMNEQSSRSHSVFTVHFQTYEKKSDCSSVKEAKFNFVDLAGSERQKLTKTIGDRFKEGCNINKSLAVLGNVINSLAENSKRKSSYVRYRDSKLTFLLKNSLGGNSKTAFIANVSPSSSYVIETLSTLMFAQRAKMIKNDAKVNENLQSGSIEALQKELAKTKALYNKLKSKYDNLENNGYVSQKRSVKKCEKCETTAKTCNNKVLQMNAILKESMIVLNKSLEKWEEQINGDMFLKKDEDLVEILQRNCISIKQLIALINVDTVRRDSEECSEQEAVAKECLAQIRFFEEQRNEIRSEIAEHEGELESLKKSISVRLNANSIIDQEFKQRHIDIETFNQFKKASRDKYEKLVIELETLKSQLVIKENESEQFRMEVESLNEKNQGLAEINEQVRKEKKEIQSQFENLKYEKFSLTNKFDQEINELKELNDRLNLDVQSVTEERDILKTSIYTIKSDNELYKEEISCLKKKIEKMNKRYDEANKEIKQLNDENTSLREKKNSILRDYNSLLKKHNQKNSENQVINNDISKFKKDFKSIISKYNDIGKEVKMLSSQISDNKNELFESIVQEDEVLQPIQINTFVGKKRNTINSLNTNVGSKNYTKSMNFLHSSQELKQNQTKKLKNLTKRLKYL